MDVSTVFQEVDFLCNFSKSVEKLFLGGGGMDWVNQIDFDFRTGKKATVTKNTA